MIIIIMREDWDMKRETAWRMCISSNRFSEINLAAHKALCDCYCLLRFSFVVIIFLSVVHNVVTMCILLFTVRSFVRPFRLIRNAWCVCTRCARGRGVCVYGIRLCFHILQIMFFYRHRLVLLRRRNFTFEKEQQRRNKQIKTQTIVRFSPSLRQTLSDTDTHTYILFVCTIETKQT